MAHLKLLELQTQNLTSCLTGRHFVAIGKHKSAAAVSQGVLLQSIAPTLGSHYTASHVSFDYYVGNPPHPAPITCG